MRTLIRWLFLGCCFVKSLDAVAQSPLEAPFEKVTIGTIANESFRSVGAAWGDYDNDGLLDLVVVNAFEPSVPTSLFRNLGQNLFEKITTNSVSRDVAGLAHSASWADYDNDGRLDLVLGRLYGPTNPLYRNAGGGRFDLMGETVVGDVAVASGISVCTSWADFDNDGHIDLFVGNGALVESGSDFLFHNNGNGRLMLTDGNPIVDAVRQTTQGSWADFDNDGDLDLVVTHYAEQGNSLYRNEGQGRFIDVTESVGIGEPGFSVGANWGDYDNDGDFDLLITNYRNPVNPVGRNYLFRNEGNGSFSRVLIGTIAEDPGHFYSGAWIDYDNDGWLDLFVTAVRRGEIGNRLYHNEGDGTFVRVDKGQLVQDVANPTGASWGDSNNDGFLDVFVANGALTGPQKNGFYVNLGNMNSWIKLRLVGTKSNRAAIGAVVRVKARIGGRDRWQMRQISGGEGWLSFNALDVSVGLGDATIIDTIRIQWPSGIVEEFHDVAVKQTMTITEGSAAGAKTLFVTNTNNDGVGSLRQAIEEANTTTSRDTVQFSIPGSGPHVISLLSSLPRVVNPIILDASTQPGYSTHPIVGIGGGESVIDFGLIIDAGDSILRGLAIFDFGVAGHDSAQVLLTARGSNVIEGCFIGVRLDGSADATGSRNRVALWIHDSFGNRIGGPGNTRGNVMAGGEATVLLDGSTSSGNSILGNRIGVDLSRGRTLGDGNVGIRLQGGSNNEIGGLLEGAANWVSAAQDGFQIVKGANNRVLGNFVGVAQNGVMLATSPAGSSIQGSGIVVQFASGDTRVIENTIAGTGGSLRQGGAAAEALIGGLVISDSADVSVLGNWLGTSRSGNPLTNWGSGIIVHGASQNVRIGGLAQGEGNVVRHSALGAIELIPSTDAYPVSVRIRGNQIAAGGSLGIDLLQLVEGKAIRGVNLNDPGDADAGANGLINQPVLSSVESVNGVLQFTGSLETLPSENYDVDFYGSSVCGQAGRENALSYIGTVRVKTDATGSAVVSGSLRYILPAGNFVTATATDRFGNTSELSGCRSVISGKGDRQVTIPFRAFFGTTNIVVTDSTAPGRSAVQMMGAGPMSDLGRGQLEGAGLQIENSAKTISGDYLLTTPEGDSFVVRMAGELLPAPVGPVNRLVIQGEGRVVSGIGRFEGMESEIEITGWMETRNTESGEGVGFLEFRGEIPRRFARLVVTTTQDDGPGSLRAAMIASNASADLETIVFELGGAPPWLITPRSLLPALTQPVQMDATTQSGYAGAPLVEVRGAEVREFGQGLQIKGGFSLVRGLGIHGFLSQVALEEKGSNVIEACYLGFSSRSEGDDAPQLWERLRNFYGIRIDISSGNRVGGTSAGRRNILSGLYSACEILGSADNRVEGNWIGLDATGSKVRTNSSGILISGSYDPSGNYLASVRNLVGGHRAGAGNILSGNRVAVSVDGRQNKVSNNWIGVDSTGTNLLGNGNGIWLSDEATSSTTGSFTNEIHGNVIGGSRGAGIRIQGGKMRVTSIQGNWIGTDRTGMLNLANLGNGIQVERGALQTRIGGTNEGSGNVIAFNGLAGVYLGSGVLSDQFFEPPTPSVRTTVRGNSLYMNGRQGVMIGRDPSLDFTELVNDPLDRDTGPNAGQNHPVLERALYDGKTLILGGILESKAEGTYEIDFYGNEACDDTGYGEGRMYLGTTTVVTDAAGRGQFEGRLTPKGTFDVVVATATDAPGNTSIFSPCVKVVTESSGPLLEFNVDATGALLHWSQPEYVLEGTEDLSNPVWIPVGEVGATQYRISGPQSGYFRLRHR